MKTFKLLILSINFSGVTKKISEEFEAQGLVVFDIPVRRIPLLRFISVILGVNYSIQKWRLNSIRIHNKLNETHWAYMLKSWLVSIEANKVKHKYDAILQISGTFSYLQKKSNWRPHFLLTDYTKYLSLIHNNINSTTMLADQWLESERKLYEAVDVIFLPASYLIDSMSQHYGINSKKCKIIGYGSKFPPSNQIKTVMNHKILFVGKDFKRKGGESVLNAFIMIKSQFPAAELLIVGPPVNPASNVPGVKYIGIINDEEQLLSIYQQCSVFVMPSNNEPFGLVFLEAMANGLVCIGRNIDAMPEILSSCGLVVNEDWEISEAICNLFSDETLFDTLSAKSIDVIRNYYNWPMVAKSMIHYINNEILLVS